MNKKKENVTIDNYQKLAMRTCLPTAKNWQYCYCEITSEIGEALGKWGKYFRDGEFDKEKLTDELGDVFWGIALACTLFKQPFAELWRKCIKTPFDFNIGLITIIPLPSTIDSVKIDSVNMAAAKLKNIMAFALRFCKDCGIKPTDCLKRNIAKLSDRKVRGVLKGNGDNR